jgi:hypothetical protein
MYPKLESDESLQFLRSDFRIPFVGQGLNLDTFSLEEIYSGRNQAFAHASSCQLKLLKDLLSLAQPKLRLSTHCCSHTLSLFMSKNRSRV